MLPWQMLDETSGSLAAQRRWVFHGMWSSLLSSISQHVLIAGTVGGVQHVRAMRERRRVGTVGA